MKTVSPLRLTLARNSPATTTNDRLAVRRGDPKSDTVTPRLFVAPVQAGLPPEGSH